MNILTKIANTIRKINEEIAADLKEGREAAGECLNDTPPFIVTEELDVSSDDSSQEDEFRDYLSFLQGMDDAIQYEASDEYLDEELDDSLREIESLFIRSMLDIYEALDRETEADVRERAYYKWENAGRPEGRDLEFWLEAELDWHKDPFLFDPEDRMDCECEGGCRNMTV